MTGNDVKNILKKYIEQNLNLGGVKVYKDVHPPIKSRDDNFERIVVNTLGLTNNSWRMGYANVNWFVPVLNVDGYDEPNGKRMGEVERLLDDLFKRSIFKRKDDEEVLIFREKEPITQEEDKESFSYFINVKLKIQITNFK